MPPKKARYTKARRERMARALDLREQGATYRQIADRTGVSSRQAYLDVQDALEQITMEPAIRVLKLELLRTERLFTLALNKAATERDMTAVNAAIRVLDRRAKYLGLDQVAEIDPAEDIRTALKEMMEGEVQVDPSIDPTLLTD